MILLPVRVLTKNKYGYTTGVKRSGKRSLFMLKDDSINSVKLLTRNEAANLLRITLPTLHHWSKTGLIQAYFLGRRIYYKEDELLMALQKRWDRTGSLPPAFLNNTDT